MADKPDYKALVDKMDKMELKFNKQIDDMKNIINEKDLIIENLNKKIEEMQNEISILNKEREIITKKSTEEDVAKYLKKNLGFSLKAIDDLGLDGESLLFVENEDIDEIEELTDEQKKQFKNLIRKYKTNYKLN